MSKPKPDHRRNKAISPAQAYRDYQAMGPARSLRGLRQKYGEILGDRAPSLASIHRWSGKHAWQRRLRELKLLEEPATEAGKYPAIAKAQAVVDAAGPATYDAATDFNLLARKCLRLAREAVDTENLPAADLLQLALLASRQAQVMSGGVSDRTARQDVRADWAKTQAAFEAAWKEAKPERSEAGNGADGN